MEKKIRTIAIAVMVAAGLVWLYNVYLLDRKATEKHLKLEYNGIINKIHHYWGDRGVPMILVDTQWIYLNVLDSKFSHYVLVGDSIYKESGSETVKIFRKNSDETWSVKVFK